MVSVVPTLAAMADIYRLPRAGGPNSPRFTAYHARVAATHGLSAYNPMAGPHALEAVEALLALDAEAMAAAVATEILARLEYHGHVTLAVVVASPGMWTDRIATDIGHRTLDVGAAHHGLVMQWARESITATSVRNATIAETVRVVHTAQHGAARAVHAVLEREGRALAMGDATFARLNAAEQQAVEEAFEIIGDSANLADIVAIAFGDDAARTLGYPPLGLPLDAGVRWAAMRSGLPSA